MITGAGLGLLIAWAAYPEHYISLGVIGCALGQFGALWWLRRNRS